MTDQIPMRSASERRDTAAKLADHLENMMVTAQWMPVAEGIQAVHALRALIEVPEVGITEDEIVTESVAVVLGELDLGGDRKPTITHLLDAFRSGWLDADDVETAIRRIGRAAVRGAEQAALEHWEPADIPSQEFMLRHLGIDARAARIKGDTHIFIPTQYIEREVF